jgi:hypothetical protein
MAPTTAAERMLVASSITRSLDWMLTRERKRRLNFGGAAASPESESVGLSIVVVIGSRA